MKNLFYLFTLIGIILFFQSYAIAQSHTENDIKKSPTKSQRCFSKNNFGIDFGVGTTANVVQIHTSGHYQNSVDKYKFMYPAFAVGIRYLHYVNPYFGLDAIKLNYQCPFKAIDYEEFMNLQVMTGIRLNTPTFFNCMSGYTAARLGYGLHFIDDFVHGMAFEAEVGLNITSNIFIAFSYNLITNFIDRSYMYYGYYQYISHVNRNTYALRIGFNFGK